MSSAGPDALGVPSASLLEAAVDEDADILELARELRVAGGLRVAARRALALARRYREEEGPRGARELACVRQALAWRATARGATSAKPGLARTSAPPTSAGRRTG